MIVVIIAGGSGTRLWPLSTPDYPKHLLNLTGSKSLLQYTYARSKEISQKIYVLTDLSHANHVKDQLPEVPQKQFIVEPGRRGTASCIVAALQKIGSENDKDEPIAFLAADHYVRDVVGFVNTFNIAESVAKNTEKIVLIGAEPDHPATGFGYIQKGVLYDGELVYKVSAFKEKPDYSTAQKYISSGQYLWNCGYFVGTHKSFLREMKNNATNLYDDYLALEKAKTPEEYEQKYLSFENISIDYALIEKVPDLLVIPASFDWMDLGSYTDLHKAVESDEQGNHFSGENIETEGVENSFIRNHESKPVAVIGLDNVVVINTKDGLLVTRKDLAQKVGDISKRFNKKD